MADYIVTTLADENDGGGGGTGLSLREALVLANGDPGFDTITFDASLAGQAIVLANGQLTISADVIINGDIDGDGGADITVSGNNASRVFHIEDGNAATTIAAELKGLVIRDGLAVVGGGIALGAAEQLLLTNSTVSGNRAEDGAGIYNSPSATVTLLDTTLSGNRAEFNGGGIFSYGTILLINATVSGNMAEGNSGGGILNAGTATLTNTTLSGNSAEYFGGGLHGSGAASLVNSIVAGNFENLGIGGDDISSLGPLNLAGGNIVGDTRTVNGVTQQTGIALTDIFASVTNAPLTNVPSGTLTDNGGPVQTIALAVSATNPAIDSGNDAIGPGLDARGLPRVDMAGAAHNGANISDLGALELQATPAGMIVDTLVDEAYGGGDYFAETLDGHLSLREALGLANGNPDANTITFDASLAGGTLYLAGGQLSITTDGVTVDGDIDGDGNADITISADHSANANDANSRVFRIDDGNDATTIASTLNGLVIRDGFLAGGDPGNLGGGVLVGKADALTLTDSTVTDNKVVIYGGGIANLGTITLTNTTLSDNSGAIRGGGIANFGTATLTNTALSGNGSSDGGGIFNARNAGLTLTDTALSGNSANSRGGGILTYGAATLTNVTLSDNIAHHGGGIYSGDFNSNTTLTNTTLSGNEAGDRGGGICNYRGTATLINTTLSGNSADQGGGIYSDGGILNSGTATLINTTLSGNEADDSGGGIFIINGAVTLTNSIVAGNEAGTNGDDIEQDATGILGLTGGNIIGDTFTHGASQQSGVALTEIFASVTNDPNTGVLSGTLADNGGPVQTIALAASVTNPAIDAGNDALDADGDARGLARLDVPGAHNGGNISDLGAFELQASAFETPGFVVTTLSDVVDPFDNLTSLREALALANGDPDANTITFDAALTGGSNPGVDDGGIVLGGTELTISTDVTINGDLDGDGDADITVSGDDASRVFNVDGAGTVTASLNGLVIRDGFTAVNGGGIRVAADDALTVTNSTITENVAFLGGAGGIMNYGATTLINTVVSDNTSYTQSGGGILNLGTLDITNSTLSGNHGAYNGGAIFNAQGVVTLINSTVSNNAAGYAGGGIFNNIGGVTLTNTTVVGNEADYGGGIFNRGGASTPATLTLTNSTVSGNLASADGGGIQNNDSTSTTTLVNTIVAGNDASSGDDVRNDGTLALSGGNIVGDTFTIDGGSPQTGVALTDIFAAIDPATGGGQLADNGGSVETIALNRDAANLALDNGDPDALDEAQAGLDLNGDGDTTDVIATDARGFDRDVGGVDLGAFEQQDDASFIVTTLDDGVDNDFGGGNLAAEMADGGGLSLREALALANGDPTMADTITFDASLDNGTLTLEGGELVITSDVTIDGDIGGDGTPDITIDATGASRVLNIISGTSSLNGLTITGGDTTCGCFGDYGGGISVGSLFYGTTADVTISNSIIRDNAALYGGGIAVDFASTVRLVNATVSDNSADYVGGGIASHGTLTVINSTVSGNTAGYIGGGIANDGTLTVVNSTLSGNRSEGGVGGYAPSAGGGLYNVGTATLTNATISGNTSGYAGGGIYNSGSLTLTNATVANNTAVYGGGLYNADCGCGDVTIGSSTFSGNFASEIGGGIYNAAGTVALVNSIVAGNGAGYSNSDIATDTGSATTTFGGVNVFSQTGAGDAEDIDGAALADVFASVIEIDPTPLDGDEFQAGELQNNGGQVATIAILAGGVAYDAGSDLDAVFDHDSDPTTPDVPIPTDARGLGFNRFFGQHVDIGAFESQNAPPVIDLDGGGGGTGFAATYLENAAPVQVVSNAITIDDPNDPNLAAATVLLANAQAGDVMAVGDLSGLGITAGIDTSVAGQITVTLTGPSAVGNFEEALKRVFFSNASENPATTQRVLNIAVSDGTFTSPNATTTIDVVSQNDAPVNTIPVSLVPATQNVEGNHDLTIAGLSITDVDAGGAPITTTLAVLHGTLAVGSAGGAAVGGSGTNTVTLTGTVAQINATLAAANNVVYSPAHDFFGTDTLTMLTSDGGNTGLVGGVQTDTDQITINVNTLLTGTPDPDSFIAPLGHARVDGLGSTDTITFNFALTDATVTYQGNKVIIDHGSSHTVTTGLETFVFTDGTVDNADANRLVDDLFYYSRHHDVWNARADADLHYDVVGWKEGRDPSAFFDTSIYLAANPDVAAGGGNPLTHYDAVGWTQGRVPSLAFGTREYLDANPDVKAAGIDPLFHFLTVGAGEGRQPIAPSALVAANGFDFVHYLANNPDVAAAGIDPLWHFQNIGWQEGRDPNALFDASGYLSTYTDVANANINPLDHYNLVGWKEGRDPSVGFDTTSYLAAYSDVAAANVNPLSHFLHVGIHEGRQPFADGVWG